MQQAQVARFPGFGIIYPDGHNGIKVVKTFVQGPKKMVQPDGSVEWTTPPPTIHELYGFRNEKGEWMCGGFVYASGEPVTDRTHLGSITDMKMRNRALAWFDGDKSISELATQDVPQLASAEDREKKRPEPLYVVSTDVANLDHGAENRSSKDMPEREGMQANSLSPEKDALSQILSVVSGIAETVKKQGEAISELQKTPLATIDTQKIVAQRQRKGEAMKAKWADPDFRAKQKAAREKKVTNGQNAPETNKEVPTV